MKTEARHVVVSLALIALLTGCGGGGDVDSSTGTSTAFSAPVLTVTAQPVKTLVVEWTADVQHTSFILLEDPDGEGPEAEKTLATLPADSRAHAIDVFLPAQVSAVYRLQGCGAPGCSASAPARVPSLTPAIGYVKPARMAADDQFGQGIALSADGQRMAVGAPGEDGSGQGIGAARASSPGSTDSGSVTLFERRAGGWVESVYIKPAVSQPGARFGYGTALSDAGDVLLVGAPAHNVGAPGSGAAYVFRRQPGGGWSEEQVLKAPVPEGGAQLGASVALSGDGQWAAVAQPESASGGSVLMYRRVAGAWVLVEWLQGHNTDPGDQFGEALAISADGTTLVVGAYAEHGGLADGVGADNSLVQAGAAYVFTHDAAGAWQQRGYLKAPQPGQLGRFGAAVSVSGDGRLVLAGEAFAGQVDVPVRAHMFALDGSDAWLHAGHVAPPAGPFSLSYGLQMALSADASTLAVAAPYEQGGSSGLAGDARVQNTKEAGAVYLYRRQADGGWSSPRYVKASNNQTDFYFGWTMALSASGTTLAVFGYDHSGSAGVGSDPTDRSAPWAGAVYLY